MDYRGIGILPQYITRVCRGLIGAKYPLLGVRDITTRRENRKE